MFTPSLVLTILSTFGICFFFFFAAAESKEKVAQHMEELSKNSDVSFFSLKNFHHFVFLKETVYN